SGLSSRTGVWFSRDVNYGYNNDDGSNTYGALGYGWEVGVTRNAMSPGQINAGQAVPHLAARPDPLDFGVISPDFFKTVTLTVENEGIGSLVVNPSTAFVLGPDQTYFEVVPAQPILTLGPDESGEILVRFSPSGILGLIDDAYLNILSNDPRNSGITTVSLVGETQEGVSELIFYDGFRYPDGSLLTAAPSPWVHQSGGNNYRIEGPGSLEYDNFQRPIGRKVRHHNTDGTGAFDEDVRREFEEVSTPPSGQQSVYVSMLVYVESVPDSLGGGYFCHFFDTSGDTFDAPRGLLFVRRHTLDGSQAQFGVRFSPSGSTIFAPNQLPLNQTHLLIMKLTMVAGAADRVDLYVNPALSVAEAAPNATQLSGGGTGSADIARGIGAIGLRQGPFTFNGTLDEIRVGTSWGSVASGVSKPILLLNKQIDVPVGGTVAITSASLLSTDAETPNSDDLLYHIVSLPKYGYLLVDGLELNTYFNDFTQEDINNGLIAYRHEGASIPLDTFIFEVIDPSGESTGGTFRFRILGFTSVREWVLYE
ncbi:hypothetical protein HQ520_02510, partial [bacterium]|nr:hypothetical protein [bacterium]